MPRILGTILAATAGGLAAVAVSSCGRVASPSRPNATVNVPTFVGGHGARTTGTSGGTLVPASAGRGRPSATSAVPTTAVPTTATTTTQVPATPTQVPTTLAPTPVTPTTAVKPTATTHVRTAQTTLTLVPETRRRPLR
jgi:hypothetical protein